MSEEKEKKLAYDPLVEIINFYSNKKSDQSVSKVQTAKTVEERLKNRIIDGEKKGLEEDLKLALVSYKPLDIINTILLDGMKVVGELFGKGEMQLPFVLQSAEVMKTAVAYLEPFMEKTGDSQKGTMVLATVKGDVHDIGKNLVDIILTNNGYKVINLGIKCPVETMLTAMDEHKADAIGMSGLLVKSTMIMKENLEVMTERSIQVPVLLGGAALTRRYVEEDLRAVFKGPLFYCEDAFSGLRVMEKIISGESLESAPKEDLLKLPADSAAETIKRIKLVRHQWNKVLDYIADDEFIRKNTFGQWSVRDIIAHFIGWEKVTIERLQQLMRGNLSTIRRFTDEDGQRFNDQCVEEYSNASRPEIMDAWNEMQTAVIAQVQQLKPEHFQQSLKEDSVGTIIAGATFAHEYEHLEKVHVWLQQQQKSAVKQSAGIKHRSNVARDVDIPKVPFYGSRIIEDISLDDVFPYINEIALFRGQWQFTRGKMNVEEYEQFVKEKVRPVFDSLKLRCKNERLLIPKVTYGYFPCQSENDDLIVYQDDLKTEKLRFTFPRQHDGHYYCISDFFTSKESGRIDVIGCVLVTVGQQASDYSAKLFESNNYSDYLYFHGLSVETAEALAEYWHCRMRAEMGIQIADAKDVKKLFQQSYRGSRYSFGYPACPNLEDQTKLFQLLQPQRIGVSLTEEFHLVPEQSTSAIVVHHPEAKYFNVK
ncbi:B12-binding domain-containing protein [bacterium]|nr:B12-binding domain-containing protein [bacterium]